MSQQSISGVFTALVTPMNADGSLNWEDFARILEHQVSAGVNGVVPVGTTGESPTLDPDEHIEVVRFTAEKVAGRIPVIAGTGANSTSEAIHLTKLADQAGADAFLQVAPYYNKPSQAGLIRHFSAIAEATTKPIVLYSIPGRCGIEIGVETIALLRENYPHVNVVKEAGGSCDRVSQIIDATGGKITVLSGDDSLTLPFISVGARGVISVASNLAPEKMRQMVVQALDNDFAGALAIHQELFPLFRAMLKLDTNPVPIKQALYEAGKLSSPEVRSPMAVMDAGKRDELKAILGSLK